MVITSAGSRLWVGRSVSSTFCYLVLPICNKLLSAAFCPPLPILSFKKLTDLSLTDQAAGARTNFSQVNQPHSLSTPGNCIGTWDAAGMSTQGLSWSSSTEHADWSTRLQMSWLWTWGASVHPWLLVAFLLPELLPELLLRALISSSLSVWAGLVMVYHLSSVLSWERLRNAHTHGEEAHLGARGLWQHGWVVARSWGYALLKQDARGDVWPSLEDKWTRVKPLCTSALLAAFGLLVCLDCKLYRQGSLS